VNSPAVNAGGLWIADGLLGERTRVGERQFDHVALTRPTYGTVTYGTVANMTTLQTDLLTELEPVVAANLDRHLGSAKDWQPQDYVPWSRGRDFAFLGGEDWRPEDSPLDPVAQTAMIVNLLTEDNLPSYHREIATRFGRDGAWGQWVGRWTAEEGRHSIALRDYLVVTRGVDPVRLEALRMASSSYLGMLVAQSM